MKQLTIFITMLLCAVGVWAQGTASQKDAYTDLKWAGVTGPVKRIVVVVPDANDENRVTYYFDRRGHLQEVQVNGNRQSIRRDEQGRITFVYSSVYCDPCGDGSYIDLGSQFEYDARNRVETEIGVYLECGDVYHYSYDQRGWCVSATAQAEGDCDDTPRRYSYSYSHLDAYGNWWQRVTTIRFLDANGQTVSSETFTTRREIIYWE